MSIVTKESNPELYNALFEDETKQLQQENNKLKDNWNKLREYIITKYTEYDNEQSDFFYGYKVGILGISDKMQELEKGDSNE